MGVPGVASAIFTTVRDAACNVVMISQASSEHSVCFAVKSEEADRAVGALRARFADAIAAGRISAVECIRDCAVLAAVGRLMCERKGVAATMFSALAKANVNIRSIAQGCSEYNITVLVDQRDSVRALRAVHGRFYLATLPLAVAVVGPGLIGRTFLDQIAEQASALRDEFDIDVRVLGIASSTRMVLSDAGLDPEKWGDALSSPETSVPADLTALGKHLANNYIPNCVIVDATASASPPEHYLEWMKVNSFFLFEEGERERERERERAAPFFFFLLLLLPTKQKTLSLSLFLSKTLSQNSFYNNNNNRPESTSSRQTRSSTAGPWSSTPPCGSSSARATSITSTRCAFFELFFFIFLSFCSLPPPPSFPPFYHNKNDK